MKKRHKNEPMGNFKMRRKESNKRRRDREEQNKWIRTPEEHKEYLKENK